MTYKRSVGTCMGVCVCVPVLLQCFRKSRAVVRVDAWAAQLYILQTSRKDKYIHWYQSCAYMCMNVLHWLSSVNYKLGKSFSVGFVPIEFKVLHHIIPVVFSAVVGEVDDLEGGRKNIYWICTNHNRSTPALCVSKHNELFWQIIWSSIRPGDLFHENRMSFSLRYLNWLIIVHRTEILVSIQLLIRALKIQTVEGFPSWSKHHMYFGSKPLSELILR